MGRLTEAVEYIRGRKMLSNELVYNGLEYLKSLNAKKADRQMVLEMMYLPEITPVIYHELDFSEKKKLRKKYIEKQKGLCMYCGGSLNDSPPKKITEKPINWEKFPDNFLQYPIHLQHSHKTGLTEGVVHSYCNAVLWQYEGR